MVTYCCPMCQGPLTLGGGSMTCDFCTKTFVNVGEIPNLDYLQSTESLVFDCLYVAQDHLNETELNSAKDNAARLLKLLWDGPVNNIEILEIAAGRGELTVGLFLSRDIQESNIYCFDHSVQSMHILTNTLSDHRRETSNVFHTSIQDVNAMAFMGSFDLVVGNAALHHFIDFDKIIDRCHALLKPGGKMLFTEPFLAGYSCVARIWIQIYEELYGDLTNLDSKFVLSGDLGYLGFIINDIRVRSGRKRHELAKLTDKHLFIESDFQSLADNLKIHVAFYEYSTQAEAENLMNGLLDTYSITHPKFRERSLELWNKYIDFAGKSFFGLDSHFKSIVYTKPLTPS